MDGQAEHTIQTLEGILRAFSIDFNGNWNDHLPLIELSYYNSYISSISMAPFEALYCRRCQSLVGWFKVGEFSLLGLEVVYEGTEKFQMISDTLKHLIVSKSHWPTIEEETLSFK